MSEYVLESLDSVDPTFDAEASEGMDEDDLVRGFEKILCGIVAKNYHRYFLSFKLDKLFKLGSARAAELARMMIGRSDNIQLLGSQSFLKQEKF